MEIATGSQIDADAKYGGRRGAAVARNSTIDSFRGLSILLVIAFHYLVRWAPPFYPTTIYGYSATYSPMWELGRFGVEFFFVISGTVISLTIERSRNVLDFACKRFSRIYPALLFACLLTFPIANAFGSAPLHRSVTDIISSLLMLPAILPSKYHFQYVDGVYWSLAVEFKFYAAVAIAFYFLERRFWMGLIAFGALGSVGAAVLPNLADKVFIHQYISFFLFGVAIAQWHFSRNNRAAMLCLLTSVIFFLENIQYLTLQDQPSTVAAIFVASGMVLIAACICLEIPLNWRPLVLVGQASYSLYLVHQNIGLVIIQNLKSLGASDAIATGAACVSSVLLALLMFRLIEGPAQRLLRRSLDAFPATQQRRQNPVV